MITLITNIVQCISYWARGKCNLSLLERMTEPRMLHHPSCWCDSWPYASLGILVRPNEKCDILFPDFISSIRKKPGQIHQRELLSVRLFRVRACSLLPNMSSRLSQPFLTQPWRGKRNTARFQKKGKPFVWVTSDECRYVICAQSGLDGTEWWHDETTTRLFSWMHTFEDNPDTSSIPFSTLQAGVDRVHHDQPTDTRNRAFAFLGKTCLIQGHMRL